MDRNVDQNEDRDMHREGENNPETSSAATDQFDRELREAFARRPAPPSLKRRLIEQGLIQEPNAPRLGLVKTFLPTSAARWKDEDNSVESQNWTARIPWQKLAACLALTAVLAGGVQWRMTEERRKEEAAREQVETALRVTSQALNHMNARLAARRRDSE